MIRHHHLMLSTVGVAMLATAAMAQTSAPTPPSSAPAAPTATQSTASTAAETNLAGQGKWRTSKLIGVDVYGPDDKKVGDVTEVIVDKTGKVEMVTIGVGGFLGIGSKDVAVPFDQVTWSDQPIAPPAPAPAPAAPAATQSSASAPAETNLAGQGKWRTSKLIGVDVYGPDDKKVGDVTEVIVDKTGKVEMVTVGVGGFLGIGAKDVAIPFEQVSWSDQPIAPPAPAPAASGSGTAGSGSAMPSAPPAAAAPKAPAMYPDHGKITLTKDQLKSAPSVTYSGT